MVWIPSCELPAKRMTASRICSGRRSARPAEVGVADSGKTGEELTVWGLGTLMEQMGCCQCGPRKWNNRKKAQKAQKIWWGEALERLCDLCGGLSCYSRRHVVRPISGRSREHAARPRRDGSRLAALLSRSVVREFLRLLCLFAAIPHSRRC